MNDKNSEKESLLERGGAWLRQIFKLIYKSFNACLLDNVNILASGLVYSTLVAVVPFISFMVAFFAVFGIADQFFTMLLNVVSDILGQSIGESVIETLRIYSTNAMGLGVFGLVSFLITAVFLVNKIYSVINQMFHTQPTSVTIRRFSNFFLILIIGVFLLSALISFSSDINNKIVLSLSLQQSRISFWKNFLLSLPQFLSIWCMFFVLYKFVPNAKVKTRYAFLGANVGIIGLLIANALFKKIVSLTVSYSVIYGSLASILFVLLFVYIFWIIVLICAKLVYVSQFKPDMNQIQGQPEPPSVQISQAINLLMLVCKSYSEGKGAVTDKIIIRKLGIAPALVYSYLEILVKNEIFFVVDQRGKGFSYIPARPLDTIYIKDVSRFLFSFDSSMSGTIGDAVSQKLSQTGIESMGNLTVENLLERI